MGDPQRPVDSTAASPGSRGETSERLLARAQRGERTALNLLFERHLKPLQRWAHGRLPHWARAAVDTADLVQETLLNTFRHLDRFEPRGQGALRAYLRQSVDNRIKDQYRQIARRGPSEPVDDTFAGTRPSPLDETIARETEARYRAALERLRRADRELIVARVELEYSFEQLALMSGRRRADSARIALHRALVRLAGEMAGA
jgi:RNA polymerase sigma-70 factor (ECF subfamily)